MLTTPAILEKEQFFLKWAAPYMAPADMIQHPRLCNMSLYLSTREHFACQLAWVADVGADEAYSNQSLGIVSSSFYAVITETSTGTYYQAIAEETMKLNAPYQVIRSL